MKTKPNDATFPTGSFALGISKREYFASKFLAVLLDKVSIDLSVDDDQDTGEFDLRYAREAVRSADALIKALNEVPDAN